MTITWPISTKNIPVREAMRYEIYQGENLQMTDFIAANADYWSDFEYDTLMKASDYAAPARHAGLPGSARAGARAV